MPPSVSRCARGGAGVPEGLAASCYTGAMLDRIRIVLVEPNGAANVGAAARVMANMGLSDLVLVAPRCSPMDEAAVEFAAHGAEVLQSARLAESIPDALAGCVRTFATSSKSGLYHRQAMVGVGEAAADAVATLPSGPVAIAFGPERTGLLLRDLLLFDRLLTIPAAPAYPVLNLAASVVVVAYELRKAWLACAAAGALAADAPPPVEPIADDTRKRVMFGKLFASLERIGFFRGQQNPDHLRFALRRVLGRTPLTVNEVDVLIGMAQQIDWFAEKTGDPSG